MIIGARTMTVKTTKKQHRPGNGCVQRYNRTGHSDSPVSAESVSVAVIRGHVVEVIGHELLLFLGVDAGGLVEIEFEISLGASYLRAAPQSLGTTLASKGPCVYQGEFKTAIRALELPDGFGGLVRESLRLHRPGVCICHLQTRSLETINRLGKGFEVRGLGNNNQSAP